MATGLGDGAVRLPATKHTRLGIGRRRARLLERALVWCCLCGGAILMTIPFLWMVSTSLKQDSQIWLFPPVWIPSPVLWQNYTEALTILPFGRYALNTVLITVLTTVGVLLSSSLCAYGFARMQFPGRDLIFMVVLSAIMIPYAVLLIPQYIMFRYLGWIDTYLPLWVPPWFGGGAFNIFLLRQFFRTIPAELSDAARIDGASELKIYWNVIIPLAGPALATVAIFTVLNTWNDFLGPLVYISSQDKFTLALGLAQFRGLYATQWQYLMAASTVVIAPTLVLFFLAQRYFVQGIVLTGLKG
ncbi:MAG TPA: carbohydrate ABC transporter permease [Roseiflexaceae bacterium]|nr:carbohydrate ABC transporter permease [Roseiflexaceae bacterium]